MTTTVKITVSQVHEGAHVEVQYIDATSKKPVGLAAKLALGESADVVCHDAGSLLIEEVGGIYQRGV
jgi:hypothetical protein